MSDDLAFVRALGEDVLSLLEPLGQAVTSLDHFDALLLEHGWLPPETSDYLKALQDIVGQFVDVDALRDAFAGFANKPGTDAVGPLLETIGSVLSNLRAPDPAGIAHALPAPLNSDAFWGSFLRELGDGLFIRWLRRRLPTPFALLHLVGVVDLRQIDPQTTGRLPYLRALVNWEDLGQLLTRPDALIRDTYKWGGDFDAPLLLERVTIALVALGVPATLRTAPAALTNRFWDGRTPTGGELRTVEIPIVREGRPGDAAVVEVSADLVPVPADPLPVGDAPWVGIALVPLFTGRFDVTVPVSGAFRLELTGGIEGLTGPAVELRPDQPPQITTDAQPPVIDLGLALRAEPPTPFLLLGSPGSHRVELAGLAVGGAVHDPASADPEVRFNASLTGLTLTIQLQDGDGFLNKILGTKPQVLTVDTGVLWSSRTGFRFEGQAALKLVLPINKTLGPVEVQDIIIEFGAGTGEAIRITLAITARATLGPLAVAVEEVGVALTLRPDDVHPTIGGLAASWGFLPPKGLAVRLGSGPVTGGGYLFCDPDAGQYAGAIELSFKALSLKATGLLTTKLPDGRPGFSLLVIITAEFTPIQLGFGFVLTGVGGLLGINRTMSVDALRAGVKQHTLDAILFPRAPVANAPQLISALRTVFPPAEGRFTFGPMVKIGWGPTSLLEIEAALILELPSPVKLVVLGRISAALPDRSAPIVQLRLDIVGVVDFDRGEVSVDASLVDSRLAMFALTGDMALRAGWKATKTFALSAGGFNPRFTPPPDFPTLERLAISLANSDNPRLRLESYFALTANTVQFGAKIDFFAKTETFLGTFSAAAHAGIDALVQFVPFRFIADLAVGFTIAHNDDPFIEAALSATISGPRPWHVLGKVTFTFMGKRSIDVDIEMGDRELEPPSTTELTGTLTSALTQPDAWTAELPPAASQAGQVVTLRATTPAAGMLVHPLGALTVRQRAMPLELTIERFGQAVPKPGTARRFRIAETALSVDGVVIARQPADQLTPVHDDFAAGQFLDLTDDQKLARPAFEPMPSGTRVSTAARRWPTAPPANPAPPAAPAPPAGVGADLTQDTDVIDAAPDGGWSTRDRPGDATPQVLDGWLRDRLLPGGAAANGPVRAGPARYQGPSLAIGVPGERHRTAPLDTLPTYPTGTPGGTSYAQAAQTGAVARQVVTVAEVTGLRQALDGGHR